MQTELDAAHAAMEAAPDEDAARLRFYDRLANSELFLLLDADPVGDTLTPRIFDLEEGRVVLAFDTEERLAEFAQGPEPYAALPGRVIAAALSGQGVGLGLNLGNAPSASLLPAAALDWLAGTLAEEPQRAEARALSYAPPKGLPESFLAALDAKLARLGGLARRAHLVAVTYAEGRGHLVVFEGAAERHAPALAKAVSEALIFSGVEAGAVDVAFLAPGDPALARVTEAALSFDLPVPAEPEAPAKPAEPAAPGSDPDRPPRLR